jgi:predicted dinucleotide-binding enzyme
MKILIIGGKGTIGKKVCAHFSKKHQIIIGGRNSGDVKVDIGKGTIGKKVCAHFSKKHQIIIGGRNSGDVKVDIADSKSIEAWSMVGFTVLSKRCL